MNGKVIIVRDDDTIDCEMLPLLKRRLRGLTVIAVASDAPLTPNELESFDALVIIVSGKQSAISLDSGIGRILSAVTPGPDSLVFPVLMNAAQMPELSELPESLHWFALTNALQINSDNIEKQTIRLARAIRDKATFSDPISAMQFVTNALRHAFRPMCWGPLWAFGYVLLAFALAVGLMFANPALQQDRSSAGVLIVSLMCPGGLIAGIYAARNLRLPGMVAGAVLGLVSPATPLLFVLLIILIPFLINRSGTTWYSIISVATIGVPFALAPFLLTMGYAAKKTDVGQTISRRSIVRASIVAVLGFACGGAIGMATGRNAAFPFDNVGFGIFTIAYIAMAGISIGLLRGICATLNERPAIASSRTGSPSLTGKPPTEALVIGLPEPSAATVETRGAATHRNVFISYRRNDSGHMAKDLYDLFAHRMPGAHIFRDVDAIPYGLDYRKILQDEVVACDVVVAVIGPRWIRYAESTAAPLWGNNDFVQFELEQAMQHGIPIVVALVNGAAMPHPSLLPESLRDLEKASCVDVSGSDGLNNLCQAIAGAQRKSIRPVSRIEQVESAIRLGSRNALRWGLAGAFIGVISNIAIYFTQSNVLEVGCLAAGLVLLPAACGAMTGRHLRSKPAVIALTLLVPLFACLASMAIMLIAILVRVFEVITIDRSAGMKSVHIVMACGIFLGAIMALAVVALHLVRQRRRRIRVWNGIVYAALGAMAGGVAGGLVGSSVLLLPTVLMGFEAKVDYFLIIMAFAVGGITAGMVHGAAPVLAGPKAKMIETSNGVL